MTDETQIRAGLFLDKGFGREQRSDMKPRLSNRLTAALTLVEVMVLVFVLAVLVAIILPALAKAKTGSRIHCINCLKQIGLSYQVWAGDNSGKYPIEISITNGGSMEMAAKGDVVATFQVMSNELSTPRILVCPQDANRSAATNFYSGITAKNISYFVGLDANTNSPHTFLSGDRNIVVGNKRNGILEITRDDSVGWSSELHNGIGNIAFADGSVQQTASRGTSWNLREVIRQAGLTTNRLAIP